MAEQSPVRTFVRLTLLIHLCATLTWSERCNEISCVSSRIDEVIDELYKMRDLKQSVRNLSRTQAQHKNQLQELKRQLPGVTPTTSAPDGFQRDVASVSADEFFPLRQLVFQEKRNRQNFENMVSSALNFFNVTYSALWQNFTEMKGTLSRTEDQLSNLELRQLVLDKEVSAIRNTLENITTALNQKIPKTPLSEKQKSDQSAPGGPNNKQNISESVRRDTPFPTGMVEGAKDPGGGSLHLQVEKALQELKEIQINQSKMREEIESFQQWSDSVKAILEAQPWNDNKGSIANIQKAVQGLQWSLIKSEAALNQIRDKVDANQGRNLQEMSWNYSTLKDQIEGLKTEMEDIKTKLKQKEVADRFRKAMLDSIKNNEEIVNFPSGIFEGNGRFRRRDSKSFQGGDIQIKS